MYSLYRIAFVFFKSIGSDSGWVRSAIALIGIPILASFILIINNHLVQRGFLQLIITSVSIFVGFSMNAVVLMLKYANNSKASSNLVAQVRNTTIYIVVIGTALVILSLIGITLIQDVSNNSLGVWISSFYYFIVAHFFAVILLYPARIFVVIEKIGNIEEEETQKVTITRE